MRLATFEHQGLLRIGVVDEDQVVDLSAAAPGLPADMVAFLATGDEGLARAREVARTAGHRIPLADVELKAPVRRPGKFLVHGANYRASGPLAAT